MHQRGPALVRIALFSLVFGAFALAMVQPSQAGTQAAPEIQDGRFDVTGPGGTPACTGPLPDNQASPGACLPPAGFADLVSGWVANETASELTLTIDSANVANSYGAGIYRFHFTIGTTDYVAGFNTAPGSPGGNGAVTPSGVATSAAFVDTLMVMKVPMTAIGGGTGTMTKMFLTSQTFVQTQSQQIYTDRAPNGAAFGQDYILGAGPGNTTVPGDSDNDQLNDTCEQEFFGGLNGTNNATEDPDGDGLTNGQECASNPRTDPTKADTDGDGVNDDQDPAPTDPATGGSGSGSNTTTSSTGSTTTAGTTSGSRSDTGTDEDPANDEGEVKNLGEAVDRLTSDMGYLGTSAGGLVAVLILCILALAVRWSL